VDLITVHEVLALLQLLSEVKTFVDTAGTSRIISRRLSSGIIVWRGVLVEGKEHDSFSAENVTTEKVEYNSLCPLLLLTPFLITGCKKL
jgi:hypothetical protein